MSDIYYAKDGLLWFDGNPVMLPEADLVARWHGFLNAERMVRHLEEKQRAEEQVAEFKQGHPEAVAVWWFEEDALRKGKGAA